MDIQIVIIPIALIAGLGLTLAAFVPTEGQPTTPPDISGPPRFGPMSRLTIATFMTTVEEFFNEYLPTTTVDENDMFHAFQNFVSDKFMLENFGEDGLH